MKNIVLFASFVFALTMFNACSDPCDDVDCNGGTCDEGICTCIGNFTGPNCETCKDGFTGVNCDECVEGFTGENCDIEVRAQYLGSYIGGLMCEGLLDPEILGLNNLTIIIEEDPNDILKLNLDLASLPFDLINTADVEDDRFVIPATQSTIDLSDIPEIPLNEVDVTTTGSGTLLSEDVLELKLNFTIPFVGTTQCSAIMNRI